MQLFVLMKDGTPFQLPVESRTEVEHRLSDFLEVGAEPPTYACASTDRAAVDAMRQALPSLLDSDDDADRYEIAIFEIA